MPAIALTTTKDFSYNTFMLSLVGDIFAPTTKIEYFKNKIVMTGEDGVSVELTGETLRPKDGTGVITGGVLKIDGKVVGEISGADADISTAEFKAAAGFVGGTAPLRYVLGVRQDADQEFSFLGGEGDDVISGEGDAKNFLFGGEGHDFFFTSVGETYIDGGDGFDTVSYFGADDGVTVNLADPTQNTGAAAGDTYSSIEDVEGSFYDDKLIGDDQANHLDGSLGSDTLYGGGAGRDTLDGGTDDPDSIDIASFENVRETGGIGVSASLATGRAAADGVAGIVLKNIEGLIGSQFRDNLTGDARDNTLSGEGGFDILRGGKGADVLSGDGGAATDSMDWFKYDKANEGGDTILDYDAQDFFYISRSGFGLAADFTLTTGENFVAGRSAAATTDEATFLFNTRSGKLFFDADGTGEGKAVLLATVKIEDGGALTSDDLLFFT